MRVKNVRSLVMMLVINLNIVIILGKRLKSCGWCWFEDDDEDDDEDQEDTNTDDRTDNHKPRNMFSFQKSDASAAVTKLVCDITDIVSQVTISNILDKNDTPDSVGVDGVENTEVCVVRENLLVVVAPDDAETGINIADLTEHSGRLSHLNMFHFSLSLYDRSSMNQYMKDF